jgi:hypothetical protein
MIFWVFGNVDYSILLVPLVSLVLTLIVLEIEGRRKGYFVKKKWGTFNFTDDVDYSYNSREYVSAREHYDKNVKMVSKIKNLFR